MKEATEYLDYALWYRVFVTYAHLFFMMRCFIALQWQPRLAVVYFTLLDTSLDLLHFLIVFIPTFMAFAIAGHAMFGRRMQSFSTPAESVCSCFKLAMEFEFDWWTLSEEDFWTTATWVWAYVILVVLLMLNMVLAIIMDVYGVIRLQAGDNETLVGSVYFLVKRVILYRNWVKDEELMEVVNDLPRIVSVDELRQFLPEAMSDFQFDRLVGQCNKKAQCVMRRGVHDSYSAQMTAATKIALDGIAADIKELKSKGWMARGIEAGTLPERMLAQDCLQSCAVQQHWMNLMQSQLDNMRKKMLGLAELSNVVVTFYGASGLPMKCRAYATCHVTGQSDQEVRTHIEIQKTCDPYWDTELVLIKCLNSNEPKALHFNIYDDESDSQKPLVAVKLPVSDYFPDGYDGSLVFPGGYLNVKVEITNPSEETSV
jgi:hypothetical protein